MFFVKKQSKTRWLVKPATTNAKRLVPNGNGQNRAVVVDTHKNLPNWWAKGERAYFKAIGCYVRKALIVWFARRHPRLRLGRIDNHVCDLLNRNSAATRALSDGYATLM